MALAAKWSSDRWVSMLHSRTWHRSRSARSRHLQSVQHTMPRAGGGLHDDVTRISCARSGASNDDTGDAHSEDDNADSSEDSVADAFRRERQRRGYGSSSSSSNSKTYNPDPYDNLFKSKVLRSEVVMKEFDEIVTTIMSLARMASKFPDFDLEGKKMYLQQMEDVVGRYEVFMKRLELSDDEHSKEYLRYTNGQMLNGGFTLQTMFIGVKQSLQDYRNWVAQEERASADPIMHQRFLQWFKAQWSQSSVGRFNMDFLGDMGRRSPQALMKAQSDPEFFKAIKEISDQPTVETLNRWVNHPNIGPLVQEMIKSMEA